MNFVKWLFAEENEEQRHNLQWMIFIFSGIMSFIAAFVFQTGAPIIAFAATMGIILILCILYAVLNSILEVFRQYRIEMDAEREAVFDELKGK